MYSTTVLLLILIIPLYGYEFNENDPRNNLNAVYIRRTGPVKVLCRHRTIEFSIEIEIIPKIKAEIYDTIQLLTNICSENTFNKTCEYVIDELNTWMLSFGNTYLLTESANLQSVHDFRRKRDLTDVIRKTITLSDYGYNDLKRGLEQLIVVAKQILKQQNDSIDSIGHVNFLSVAFLTFQGLRKHSQFYDNVLEIIINKNPKAIAEIIPMDTLKSELINSQALVEKEFCEFPIDMKIIKIIELFKVSKTYSELSGNALIISIKIPTFYKNNFILNTAIAIPFIYKNATYSIIPESPYYITYFDQVSESHYSIPMTVEDRHNCTNINGKLLCYPKTNYEIISSENFKMPDYLFFPGYNTCYEKSIKALSSKKAIPIECNVKQTLHSNHIIQLEKDKFYLHLIAPSSVKFDCHQNHQIFNITEPVLITSVQKDCSIHFKNGYHAEQSDVYLKSIHLHSARTKSYSTSYNDLIEKTFTKQNTIETLRNLQPDFGDLHEEILNSNFTNDIKPPSKTGGQTTLVVIILISLFTTCSYVTILYFRFKTKTTNKTMYRSKSPDSMDTIPPEMKCQFNFQMPPLLPPKTHSLPRSPAYDVPKSSKSLEIIENANEIKYDSKLDTEQIEIAIQSLGSPSISYTDKPNVKYAIIQKTNCSDPINNV